MATQYVVLRDDGDDEARSVGYTVEVTQVEATNAQQACRKVAEKMSDADLADGVTLIAVPARNWTSGRNTFAAKTERKLIRS